MPDNTALFLKRGPGVEEGKWCLPGGHIDKGETPDITAVREAREETGWIAPEDDTDEPKLVRGASNGYVIYRKKVRSQFIPTLNDEHTGYAWAPLSDPPQPLHPGLDKQLPKIAGDQQPALSTLPSSGLPVAARREEEEDGEDMTPEDWRGLKEGLEKWVAEEEAEPEHAEDDLTEAQKAHGKLSEQQEKAIGTVGSKKREEMPEDVFLEPASRKYPVKENRGGEWKYTRKLLLAAARRARMNGNESLAKKADAIRSREFGAGEDEKSGDLLRMIFAEMTKGQGPREAAGTIYGDVAQDEIIEGVEIDRDHDGPWLSCMSVDGRKMYQNKNLPDEAEIDGKTVDVTDMLLHHEVPERKDLEKQVMEFRQARGREPNDRERKAIYERAHKRSGTPSEKKHAQEMGVDWAKLSAWYRGQEAKLEKGPFEDEPDDADVKPMKHGHGDLEAEDRKIARDEMLALDKDSVRSFDKDGRLRVSIAKISKACVNPYIGHEIPGWEELGLERDKVYHLLRDPEELKKAATSANGVQLLQKHIPVSADDHQPWDVVGSTGTDAKFEDPYLYNSLSVWTKSAIDDIESDKKKELSMGYHYRPDMTSGVYDGHQYDGVMREIEVNHVALVKDGRAGDEVVVGDSSEAVQWAAIETAIMALDAGEFKEIEHPRGKGGKFVDKANFTAAMERLTKTMRGSGKRPLKTAKPKPRPSKVVAKHVEKSSPKPEMRAKAKGKNVLVTPPGKSVGGVKKKKAGQKLPPQPPVKAKSAPPADVMMDPKAFGALYKKMQGMSTSEANAVSQALTGETAWTKNGAMQNVLEKHYSLLETHNLMAGQSIKAKKNLAAANSIVEQMKKLRRASIMLQKHANATGAEYRGADEQKLDMAEKSASQARSYFKMANQANKTGDIANFDYWSEEGRKNLEVAQQSIGALELANWQGVAKMAMAKPEVRQKLLPPGRPVRNTPMLLEGPRNTGAA
jgi:hypothetical protein